MLYITPVTHYELFAFTALGKKQTFVLFLLINSELFQLNYEHTARMDIHTKTFYLQTSEIINKNCV